MAGHDRQCPEETGNIKHGEEDIDVSMYSKVREYYNILNFSSEAFTIRDIHLDIFIVLIFDRLYPIYFQGLLFSV